MGLWICTWRSVEWRGAGRDPAALQAVGADTRFCISEPLEFLTQQTGGFLVCGLISWQTISMGPSDPSPACSLMHRTL